MEKKFKIYIVACACLLIFGVVGLLSINWTEKDHSAVNTPANGATYTPIPSSAPTPTPMPSPTPEPDYYPVINLLGGEEIHVFASLGCFEEPGWQAVDTEDGDLSDSVTVQGEVRLWKTGQYKIRYSVTDSFGQTAETVRTVIVQPNLLSEVEIPDEKIVYLTFDDGPGPYTEQLLDTLDRYGVKATFFVTAVKDEYVPLIAEIAKRGHAVGIHSYSHDYNFVYASEENFFEDFCAMRDVITAYTGEDPLICRLPGGGSNTVSCFNPGIMTAITQDLSNLGIAYFDWNVSAGDTATDFTYNNAVENLREGISQHSTAVCLQHDTNKRSVDAVGEIIVWAQKQGYQFRTLDTTCYGAHHPVVN